MKAEDLKIMGQLSLETQEIIEMKMTVKELFTCVKYITADEKQKPAEGVVNKERKSEGEKGRKVEGENEKTEIAGAVVPEREAVAVINKITRKMPLYLTEKGIADVYNLKENVVLDWLNRGLLKAHHKRNKICYYKRADVLKIRREIRKK
jgi:hypothetical protein